MNLLKCEFIKFLAPLWLNGFPMQDTVNHFRPRKDPHLLWQMMQTLYLFLQEKKCHSSNSPQKKYSQRAGSLKRAVELFLNFYNMVEKFSKIVESTCEFLNFTLNLFSYISELDLNFLLVHLMYCFKIWNSYQKYYCQSKLMQNLCGLFYMPNLPIIFLS